MVGFKGVSVSFIHNPPQAGTGLVTKRKNNNNNLLAHI